MGLHDRAPDAIIDEIVDRLGAAVDEVMAGGEPALANAPCQREECARQGPYATGARPRTRPGDDVVDPVKARNCPAVT